MTNLSPREQSNAVALAPAWWRACWNAEHQVDMVIIENRLAFICRDCGAQAAAIVDRKRLA